MTDCVGESSCIARVRLTSRTGVRVVASASAISLARDIGRASARRGKSMDEERCVDTLCEPV